MDEAQRNLLREANARAWNDEPVVPKSLDSSFKKNTAFVKKLKTSITKESTAQILKEINSLSLSKYQSELLLGTEEGLLKCSKTSGVVAAIEIVSALHQRFAPSFTQSLISWFLYNIENPKTPLPEKEEKERVIKSKNLLRVFVEFIDVGIFPSSAQSIESVPSYVQARSSGGDSLIVCVLKEALGYKLSNGNTLVIATSFIKRFPELVETVVSVNQILKEFTKAVIAKTENMHMKLKDLSKEKFEAQIRTGRVITKLENDYNESLELFQEFYTACVPLAAFFKIELFEFNQDDLDYKPNDSESVVITKDTSAWVNDEERRFYEVIPEIPIDLIEASNVDQESRGEEMNEFLIKLETSISIKEIDETSLEFWKLKLSNKASKNRLIKHLKTSRDFGKAKIYARFLKTNEKYLSDVIEEVVAYLDQGFRSQIYHSGIDFRNIVFFCELIKFRLITDVVIFHKIRRLILNLTTPNNIEILGIFFEFSGKYLLHEHSQLMEEMLNLLQIKRKNDKLTVNNKMAIANLFMLLKPPSIKSLQVKKQLKPEQEFLKILVRKELNLSNDNEVRKVLNKVSLKDPDMLETMMSLFTKPDKINYENIVPLSNILKNLNSDFKIMVVDGVLEDIIFGMEINDYRHNRIRMAQCKYIAEIYERKIIGIAVLHDLIYKILTFGHPNSNPTWNRPSELDPPDNYFRIQMVACILNTVNFRRSNFKGKLMTMLKFFDYYIWLKEHPIPKDFEFKIVDAFEKYRFERAANLKEAVERLSEVVKSKTSNTSQNEEDDEEYDDEEEDADEDDDNEEEDSRQKEDVGDVDGQIKPVLKTNVEAEAIDKDEETVAKLSYEAYERKLQEEEERKLEDRLEKEFKRMVSDSMNSQRNIINKSAPIDLPEQVRDLQSNQDGKDDVNGDEGIHKPKRIIAGTKGTIPFTLVTKKGKTIATKSLALPSDVKFANTVVEEGRKQREQKQQINQFILNSNFDD